MKVRVRMYRQGLGDCFLLSFVEEDAAAEPAGAFERHVLIDCGTLGATSTGVTMAEVARNIHDTTHGHLDLLIATHEHKDHVSGFLTEQDVFETIVVDRVWQAWTEDAADPLAQDLKKYKDDLITAARLAAAALEGNDLPAPDDRRATAEIGVGIRGVLAFEDDVALGADFAKTVHEAMTYVTRKPSLGPAAFLRPGSVPIEPDWLPGVRFYVLGPPRDKKAIGDGGDHGASELYGLTARAVGLTASLRFAATDQPFDAYCAGLGVDDRKALASQLPFDRRHRLEPGGREGEAPCEVAYYDQADAWRRIDFDWLTGAADLALQLDDRTNNTSLALAIEIVADDRVLLFPADAQLGNWLSWHAAVDDQGDPPHDDDGNPVLDAFGNPPPREWHVTDAAGATKTFPTADLLRRTVFYKVGHHASHNATLQALGLELMPGSGLRGPDEPPPDRALVAMIPVDRAVALKRKPPWQMPARTLYRRLIEKANGVVLRSDLGWVARDDADFSGLFDDAEWTKIEAAQQAAPIRVERLFIDFDLP